MLISGPFVWAGSDAASSGMRNIHPGRHGVLVGLWSVCGCVFMVYFIGYLFMQSVALGKSVREPSAKIRVSRRTWPSHGKWMNLS